MCKSNHHSTALELSQFWDSSFRLYGTENSLHGVFGRGRGYMGCCEGGSLGGGAGKIGFGACAVSAKAAAAAATWLGSVAMGHLGGGRRGAGGWRRVGEGAGFAPVQRANSRRAAPRLVAAPRLTCARTGRCRCGRLAPADGSARSRGPLAHLRAGRTPANGECGAQVRSLQRRRGSGKNFRDWSARQMLRPHLLRGGRFLARAPPRTDAPRQGASSRQRIAVAAKFWGRWCKGR